VSRREFERRKFRKVLKFGTTYSVGSVALECAVVDLHSALKNITSTALRVPSCMSPPGIGAKKVQEISETRFCTTYMGSIVALENAGVDLGIYTIGINPSALEVACPPPGHGRRIRKILETITPSTYVGSGVGVEG
jgi:hypothetical protein